MERFRQREKAAGKYGKYPEKTGAEAGRQSVYSK